MKKKEFVRFIVSGLIAMSVDLSIYFALTNYYTTSISKAISFIFGTTVAYMLNKYWTFEVKEKSMKEMIKFFALYGFSMIINVGINKMVLMFFVFPDVRMLKFFAFFCATGSSAVINFAGQKLWVFKEMNISKAKLP